MSVLTTPTKKERRRKTLAALLASVSFHILLIALIATILLTRPSPPAQPPDDTIEITMVDPPPPADAKPQFVETLPEQQTDKPPENPRFESDKDTRAASELAATGTENVPTQDGRDSPALHFRDQEVTLGRTPQPGGPPPQPDEPSEKADASPTPTPVPTNQLALLEPPKPKTPPKPQEEPRKPAPPAAPGYQPQTRVTRIRGNISNRGRSSVAANATPLGRYKKMLSDAIGSRWYYYVNNQLGLLTVGTVEIKFIVRADGRAEAVRVVRNSSNESFASCSVRAIMEAEIPPIPEELVRTLEGGRIEIEYSFTILSN